MKVFLAYASRYGTTEKCARLLSDILVEKCNEVSLVNLKTDTHKNPDRYDLIIVGGSFVAFNFQTFMSKQILKIRSTENLRNLVRNTLTAGRQYFHVKLSIYDPNDNGRADAISILLSDVMLEVEYN